MVPVLIFLALIVVPLGAVWISARLLAKRCVPDEERRER